MELLDSTNERALQVAYNQGVRQMLLVSPDLMSGLRRVLTPEPNVLSCTPWICSRGVLESCSMAVWLLDSEIDSKERVSRSLNIRLQEQYVQKRLVRKEMASPLGVESTQGNSELARKIDRRIQYLRIEARSVGLSDKKNRRGELWGFGSGPVPISKRIDSTLDAGFDYAMLSSVAHGNEFAMLSLSSKRLVHTGDGEISIPCLDPKSAVYLVFLTFEWFARASWTCFRLFGWDLVWLKSVFEKQYDRADIKDEFRFWRG